MHLTRVATVALCAVALLTGCDDRPFPRPRPTLTIAPVDYSQWAAGISKVVADPIHAEQGNPTLDVLHYDLKLSWEPTSTTFTGIATVQIRPITSASRIVLDFAAYHLDGVTVDTRPVAAAQVVDNKLIVPATVTEDVATTLSVAYHGKPVTTPAPTLRSGADPLGLTITAEGGLRTLQEPYGAFTWFPVNEQPSDEALYDVSVTVPDGWSAIAAGSPNGVGGTTFHYRSATPIPAYLQTLAVGRFRKLTLSGPREIPLSLWYRPGTDDRLLPVLRRSPDYLAYLEQRFGAYPFKTGGVVVVDAPAGVPTQQMITAGGRMPKKSDVGSFRNRLVHDWAYQWFGASVTPSSWRDLWLSEGWATYAQYLYEQTIYHFSDAALDRFLRKSDAGLRKRLGPPGRPRDLSAANIRLCPAAMLHQLHRALGDQAFFALATAWVQTQRNTAQSRASFIAFVNRRTGRNYTRLINRWLDSRTTPR